MISQYSPVNLGLSPRLSLSPSLSLHWCSNLSNEFGALLARGMRKYCLPFVVVAVSVVSVVVASAICCCSFIVVASAATCAILAFLLHFVFAFSALRRLRFAFQQLIDTSAFSMVHDIKVLNLTASPSLPLFVCLPSSLCLLNQLDVCPAVAQLHLTLVRTIELCPSALNCLQKSRPTFHSIYR